MRYQSKSIKLNKITETKENYLMKIQHLGLLILALFSSSLVQAKQSQPPVYISASVGLSVFDVSKNNVSEHLITDFSNTDTYFKFIGGNRFNEYISVEFGYVNLGGYNFSDTYQYIPQDKPNDLVIRNSDTSETVQGFIANVVFTYALSNKVEVFSKVGVFDWSSNTKSNLTGIYIDNSGSNETTSSFKSRHEGTDIFYGAGLSYNWQNFRLNIEYELFKYDEQSVGVISIGGVLHF
jgi:hypothetical protein